MVNFFWIMAALGVVGVVAGFLIAGGQLIALPIVIAVGVLAAGLYVGGVKLVERAGERWRGRKS